MRLVICISKWTQPKIPTQTSKRSELGKYRKGNYTILCAPKYTAKLTNWYFMVSKKMAMDFLYASVTMEYKSLFHSY